MVSWGVVVEDMGIGDELLDGEVRLGGCRHTVKVSIVVGEHRTRVQR